MRTSSSQPRFAILGLLLVFCLASCNGGESAPTAPSDALSFSDGVTIGIENEPCTAPAIGPINCRFVASPEFGGRGDLSFNWRIENPANGRASQGPPGPSIRPSLPCDFSSGVVQFEVLVKLLVWRTGITEFVSTITRTARITRAAGACGT